MQAVAASGGELQTTARLGDRRSVLSAMVCRLDFCETAQSGLNVIDKIQRSAGVMAVKVQTDPIFKKLDTLT